VKKYLAHKPVNNSTMSAPSEIKEKSGGCESRASTPTKQGRAANVAENVSLTTGVPSAVNGAVEQLIESRAVDRENGGPQAAAVDPTHQNHVDLQPEDTISDKVSVSQSRQMPAKISSLMVPECLLSNFLAMRISSL